MKTQYITIKTKFLCMLSCEFLISFFLYEIDEYVDNSSKFCLCLECPKSDFTCGNGSCLPIERTCDGPTDCDDESDEEVILCKSYLNT